MKLYNAFFLVAPLALGLGACATNQQSHRGSIVMKTSETEAHVCVGESEAQKGDTVNVFRSTCTQKRMGSAKDPSFDIECKKDKIGQGKIARSYNDHYSVAEFEKGTDFKEGDIVEVGPHGHQ